MGEEDCAGAALAADGGFFSKVGAMPENARVHACFAIAKLSLSSVGTAAARTKCTIIQK